MDKTVDTEKYNTGIDSMSSKWYNNSIMVTPQNEAFCRAYTTKGDTYSNAYKSYAYAYDIEIPKKEDNTIDYFSSEYKVAQNGGSRLLLKEEVQQRIKALLIERFSDYSNADARIQSIIDSGKDTDAIQAVKVLNDIKQRITRKVDITTGGRPLANLSDEELQALSE
jgi:hypothetical protein